jgi:SAM-dependent methyltransferase
VEEELGPVEQEFISFWTARRKVPESVVREAYLNARNRFGFEGANYHQLALNLYDLFAPVYGHETEADLIASHQFHSVLHAYRLVVRATRDPQQYEDLAAALDYAIGSREAPVIVDYGCGLACVSLLLAERRPGTQVFLVDIPSRMFEFTASRFASRGLCYEPIAVTKHNPYPKLPPHNICIADLVMEELKNPLKAYANIQAALVPGGLLAGRFTDWEEMSMRPSPQLGQLRELVAKDFCRLAPGMLYRKLEV